MVKFYISIYVFLLGLHYADFTTFTCNSQASCGCSSVSSVSVNQRIIGGEVAPDRAWGWMLSLQANGRQICGASLLSSVFAITAAHCVTDYLRDPSQLAILAGSNYLSRPSSGTSQKRTVKAIYVNSGYDTSTSENDIALIRFDSVAIGDITTVSLICLPASGSSLTANEDLIAIGWGLTVEGGSSVPDALRQVTLKAVPFINPTCANFPHINPSKDICAGVLTGGKDTCQGDSGGPLMKFQNNQWYLVGITSTGIGCGQANTVGKYTKVSAYITYINDVLSGKISPSTSVGGATASVGNSYLSMRNSNLIQSIILTFVCFFAFLTFN